MQGRRNSKPHFNLETQVCGQGRLFQGQHVTEMGNCKKDLPGVIGVGGGGGGGAPPTFCTSCIQIMCRMHNAWLCNALYVLCPQRRAPHGHGACMSSPMPFKERHLRQAATPQRICSYERLPLLHCLPLLQSA